MTIMLLLESKVPILNTHIQIPLLSLLLLYDVDIVPYHLMVCVDFKRKLMVFVSICNLDFNFTVDIGFLTGCPVGTL